MKTDTRPPGIDIPVSGEANSSQWLVNFVFDPPAGKYFDSEEQTAAAEEVGAGWWSYNLKDCDVLLCVEKGTRGEAISDACMRIAPLIGRFISAQEISSVHAFHEGEVEMSLLFDYDLPMHDVTQEASICLGISDQL